jgi:pimeloyl-ACP methyl ester carboxylesterase
VCCWWGCLSFGRVLVLSRVLTASSNVNVTVIGHSMGGLVARAVPMLKRYVPGSISNVITLSSPHQRWVGLGFATVSLLCFCHVVGVHRLPLPFDATLVSTLKSVNDFWKWVNREPAMKAQNDFGPSFWAFHQRPNLVMMSPDHQIW